MKFVDLNAQFEHIGTRIRERIDVVLQHCEFILGPEVLELETELAKFSGAKHCISCANGTDALMMALMALDIKAGDEVIVPDFSFFASAEAVSLIGATPVFADIDPQTYNMDPSLLEKHVNSRTKAIIPVGLYGLVADMNAINKVAEKHGLHVIEDAAQNFGADYFGKKSCSLSTIGCTSFFPAKPLGCYGDGGACFTDDDELALKMRQIRVHGSERRYHHVRLGMNGRLDTIQAAVLLEKLEVYDEECVKRNKIAESYSERLSKYVDTPKIPKGYRSVWAQYTVRTEQRDSLAAFLAKQGIPTSIHYPNPLSKQPYYLGLGVKVENPHSSHAAKTVLSLPLHPYISEQDTDRVVAAVQTYFRS